GHVLPGRAARADRGRRRGVGPDRCRRPGAGAHAARRPARAADRRPRRRAGPSTRPQGADPAHRRHRDRRRHPHPGSAPGRPRRPVPRHPPRHARRGDPRPGRRPARRQAERQAGRRRAHRADPRGRLRRDDRPRDAAADRRPRPRLAGDPARRAVDRGRLEPREPDRRDGLARGGHRGDRGGVLRDPRRVVRPHGDRGARRDRLRRHARLPAPQLPPGEDLHGRHRGARARLPDRDARARRAVQDGRRDHPRRADARPRGADPRHLVRGAQAPEVPPPAVRRRPQPLLPPLHAHRLLAAAHGGVPARVGRAAGRLRDLRPVLPAAPARQLGPRARAHPRRGGPRGRRRVGVDGLLARDPQEAPPRRAAPAPSAGSGGRGARGGRRARAHGRPQL
ncbi:MAG: Undecaprenyl-phosphate N-acetylglucosaminyl 1-phosphate transferase, partial [uncultured Solirubrobacteraceae bacterium]